MKRRTIMSKDLKVRKHNMRFLDKRLMSLVLALGLSSTLSAQDANKIAEETLKNKPVAVDPDKIKKIDEILRQQNELEGDGLILEAGELLKFSRFEEAAEKFAEAVGKYQRVSKSEASILKKISEAEQQQSRALRLFADQLVVEAVQNADENSLTAFDKAIGKLQQAKKLDDARTAEIDNQIKAVEEKIAVFEHDDKVGEARLTREFKHDEQRGSIANGILFERAKILYSNRRFIQAKTALEQILTNQPFNQHAVNLLQRTNRKLFEAGRMRRNMQYQEYLDEVEWKWSDPINAYRTEAVIKADVKSVEQDKVLGGIYKKLQIVIPKVRFEDRDLDFVVDFIKRTTRDLDEEGEGLNVIVSVNDAGGAAAPGVDAPAVDALDDALGDPIDGPALDAPAAPAGGGKARINLDADDIPVGEVIKYICDQLNLKYKVEEFAVIIGDNEKFQQLETNFYTISAGLLEIVQTKTAEGLGTVADAGGGGLDGLAGGGGDGGPNFQGYFQQLGISFPPGARIKFVQGAMRLVVTNTPENHTKLEEILRQIGIETPQISIESKFIEVNNTDIEELGMQWSVGRPNHLDTAQPNGIDHQLLLGVNPAATATNPNLSATTDLSNGIRDISLLGTAQAIGPVQAGVNLVMGDYIFQGLIRALEQESSNDVLSAPQVTAVSGKTAVIRIVEERYFPESWEVPDISPAFILGSAPQFGEPRDVGIVFEVTPQVEPDGYTISLDLKPQVLEFLRFDDSYDSVIDSGIAGIGEVDVIYQMPILSARTVETRVTIWDGETIMLGGLIKEKVIAVDDKVPYLSDIPFVGRLFRNQGQENNKQNLLVFVSARLIDPAGLPKKPNDNKGLPDFKRL